MTTIVLQIQVKDISGIGGSKMTLKTGSMKRATIYIYLRNIYFHPICMQRKYLQPRKKKLTSTRKTSLTKLYQFIYQKCDLL